MTTPSGTQDRKPHVVVVGGGFGGLHVVRELSRAPVTITWIDRRNFHLFQPLLYQVATGGLSPANIAAPLRALVKRQRNVRTLLAEVTAFDLKMQHVLTSSGTIAFDYLVVAAGSTHSYFGNDEWAEHAPGLKSIEDATRIRATVLGAFEAAERESDPSEREACLTFVIVGAGPTGVELAGAIAELASRTLRKDFRDIDPASARIILVEAEDAVLGTYPARLSESARRSLEQLGVTVRLNTRVERIDDGVVEVSSDESTETIRSRTILWGAGVQASPLASALADAADTEVETDRAGRIAVDDYLALPGHPNVYAIGDMAHCEDESGNLLPGVAPVAIQQGRYVARRIAAAAAHRPTDSRAFRYKDRGSMATIGRRAAVAWIGRWKFAGTLAWLLWLFIHIVQIVRFENRLLVFIQWGWNYLTFNRAARLITNRGVSQDAPAPEQAATH